MTTMMILPKPSQLLPIGCTSNSTSTVDPSLPKPLVDIAQPDDGDVVCGRGGMAIHHVGNVAWRMLIAESKAEYATLNRIQKTWKASAIVRLVRQQGGRFLRVDQASGQWNDIGDREARRKTSQALREGAPQLKAQLLTSMQKEEDGDNKAETPLAPQNEQTDACFPFDDDLLEEEDEKNEEVECKGDGNYDTHSWADELETAAILESILRLDDQAQPQPTQTVISDLTMDLGSSCLGRDELSLGLGSLLSSSRRSNVVNTMEVDTNSASVASSKAYSCMSYSCMSTMSLPSQDIANLLSTEQLARIVPEGQTVQLRFMMDHPTSSSAGGLTVLLT